MPRNIKKALAWWNTDENQSTQQEKEDCPCLYLVVYMDGEEPEMFWKQELFYAEFEVELSGSFLLWCKHEYP